MEPTGAAPLRPTDLREIGPYRLLGRLGEGGMGTVFLARAPTGRFVAVKVVKAEFANQEGFAVRFHAEVENARRVASFCTAQVLDNGNTGDGRPYMVTEYIAGTPLSAQISQYGALDPGPLHGVALGVAAALAAIHVAGLVHRDLKPANVILSLSGPRVIDFGIARALDRETGFTLSGELLGSPGWWAPEQVRGETITPAVDIFAWGCLVAYAGNGRHPFGRGDVITLASRVLHSAPELGTLPAPLNDLVRRATAMDPAQRPSAQELVIALVGGGLPGAGATVTAPAADPPTLVATELLSEWQAPQNVVDEPDITATFATPPPADTLATPGQSSSGTASPPASPSSTPSSSPASSPSGPVSSAPTSSSRPAAKGPAAHTSAPGGSATHTSAPGGSAAPGPASDGPTRMEKPGALSQEELARREELAAREQLAQWDVQAQARVQAQAQAQVQALSQGEPAAKSDGSQAARGEPRAAVSRPLETSDTIPPQNQQDQQDQQARRPRGTRWLIAAAAAVLAIAVTAAVLITTSPRDVASPIRTRSASPAAQRQPADLGRRFPLGTSFDDPVLVVATAPTCGLKEYEGARQTQGQLCVVRWSMINPGGALREIGSPAVSLVDDQGGRHDPAPVRLPDVIAPGGRLDRAYVFDLPLYRTPVRLTATLLKGGRQVEVRL
ncbi:serine/threonine-protein kinase [Nonomuraea montanisoli]|uniref:serine/threonine-protein kinase n=1 Tax=Nonomuraea montanisoli TaxID=2741721 RepID=UPI001F2A64C4|nr:serine/threonine-protein kinase [Nonomuraea montanisoli]